MDARKPASLKIYDPKSGRPKDLDRLIERLGTLAVAEQFGVSTATVSRWRKGIHRPSRRTISQSQKNLF
ncbi:MAG TPA: hypothetical protein VL688_00695 [Verrucomicrobiae bacterium]|jgi:hypothetical protein|nr:hypothetical protein [Verrucomicrobiae bacterium]